VNLAQFLKFSGSYRLLGKLAVSRTDARAAYARQYLAVRPGQRVLDLGCGPADILSVLPDCEYIGIDSEPRYIESARTRYGRRGTFVCTPIEDFVVDAPGSFDVVMANGVLHHLDDQQAGTMLRLAAAAMKENGRLVTLDGCFLDGQSFIARALLRMDRGKFVRDEPGYLTLARQHFGSVQTDVRHDLLSFPYSLLIMTCRVSA
jgi:2-polyprenyl-3-methyl-5-hydroxy-6-metoxy-1,4-benzoquinol methylase